MASRKEQKEQARQRRLAEEQAAAAQAARRQRLQMLGGLLLVAVAVIVVAIAISSGGGSAAIVKPQSPAAKAAVSRVDALLAGIPESGASLGKASAPVTITEYGDLECSVCDMFATSPSYTNAEGEQGTGVEDQVIDKLVRTGQAKLAYDSLDTATSGGATPGMFGLQQAAAYDAGLQGKAWYYIELFYNEQGREGADYVNQSYLEGLARQVPGLSLRKWLADLHEPALAREVQADNSRGTSIDGGQPSTPTVVVSGPKGQAALPPGIPTFAQIEKAVRAER